MKKTKTLNEQKAETLERLQAACPYPFKMKRAREDNEPYLLAVAKGRTVDTGSVEVSLRGGVFVVWIRDGEQSEFFETYFPERAVLLMDAFCALLGMQPRMMG